MYDAKQPEANNALVSTDDITVDYKKGVASTTGRRPKKTVGFIYYPGVFYEEIAYAPILRAVAEAGYRHSCWASHWMACLF